MDISPWLEFGWPVALLVLVLSGIGLGLGWFLKAYLKQQKEEFDARKKEQERKDILLTEQHGFIRDLAMASMKETASAIAQMADIKAFMQEMTRSLTIINEQLRSHTEATETYVPALQATAKEIQAQIAQIERTSLMSHSKKE